MVGRFAKLPYKFAMRVLREFDLATDGDRAIARLFVADPL